MSNKQKPARHDTGNPEWTREDMATARPAVDVLPGLIGEKAADELLRRVKGKPKMKPTKE